MDLKYFCTFWKQIVGERKKEKKRKNQKHRVLKYCITVDDVFCLNLCKFLGGGGGAEANIKSSDIEITSCL